MKSVVVYYSSFKLYVIGMWMKVFFKGVIFKKVSDFIKILKNKERKGWLFSLLKRVFF